MKLDIYLLQFFNKFLCVLTLKNFNSELKINYISSKLNRIRSSVGRAADS